MFKKLLQTLDHLIERASYFGIYLAGFLAVLMALLAAYGVIRRYALHNPEPYSYEISMMLLVLTVVLAIPHIQRVGRHLRVDVVVGRFPESIQAILSDIFVPLLALCYLVPMTWKSWENAWYAFEVGERSYSAWGPPLFPIKVMVPIGVGLLCLVLIAQICRRAILLAQKKRGISQ